MSTSEVNRRMIFPSLKRALAVTDPGGRGHAKWKGAALAVNIALVFQSWINRAPGLFGNPDDAARDIFSNSNNRDLNPA